MMFIGCFAGFIIDADKLILISASILFAAITFMALKKLNVSTKTKVGLIYSHLLFVFFPFAVLTTELACGAACMQCGNSIANLAVIALPATVVVSTIAGLFIIPAFFTFSNRQKLESKSIKSFIEKHSKKMSIKSPTLYIIDKARPVAFSFRSLKSSIFVSVGMLDILNKKEREAVMLHELAHLKQRSSVLKFSASLMKIFSPFSVIARFHDTGKDEDEADSFAIKVQGTDRHIKSAKKKIEEFEKG